MGPGEVTEGVYMVGGAEMTDQRDCSIYLVDLGGELMLIDAGAGASVDAIESNVGKVGIGCSGLSTLILTHCHIDHVGGAAEMKRRFGVKIIMHRLDAAPVARGDRRMTGADWYRVAFDPLSVDLELSAEEELLHIGGQDVFCLHTPGHTPGSISVYFDRNGQRVLFGQDIHGPFMAEFGSDLSLWRQSMNKLLALKADVLCEGHFGVYQPNNKVTAYIERYLNEYEE
jgi:glyoxylase-like metal-dependent hydrolase (beta-lactamase superfamily II)